MNTIKMSDLHAVVARINAMTNSPAITYKTINSKSVAQVGNFHLDSAYGGHGLMRISNESGGCHTIIYGHHSKHDLYKQMQAFISGFEAGASSVQS